MVTEETMNKKREAIMSRIDDDFDVDEEEVEQNVRLMIDEYNIAGSEVENAVLNKVADNHEVTKDELVGGSDREEVSEEDMEPEEVNLEDIDEEGEWVAVEAMVRDLWDTKSDQVYQKGLLADETGTVGFVSWSKSDPETMVEGEHYRIENAVTDYSEESGYYSLMVNSNTDIEFVEKEPEEVTGVAVALGYDSGLVDYETEEGEEEQKVQLRLALDDGENVHRLHLDEEQTEELTGIGLEDAREIAMENLEREDVVKAMEEEVLGHFYRADIVIRGGSNYMGVEEIEKDTEVPDVDEVLTRARSMQKGD